jgi:hypothetical protein
MVEGTDTGSMFEKQRLHKLPQASLRIYWQDVSTCWWDLVVDHKGCTRAFFTAECQQCHPVPVGPEHDRREHLWYNIPQNSGSLITFLQLIPILNKFKVEINTVVWFLRLTGVSVTYNSRLKSIPWFRFLRVEELQLSRFRVRSTLDLETYNFTSSSVKGSRSATTN